MIYFNFYILIFEVKSTKFLRLHKFVSPLLKILYQASGAQLMGRPAASPSGPTSATSFDNTTASPLQYANSPRSGPNMMNTPSPQQQTQQQQQQQQQQRQKLMQLPPHQQQLIAQQPFRQSSMQLGQVWFANI